MKHVILLGDSILDNQAYTAGGPSVIAQLRAQLPAGWQTTLLARDGSLASDVLSQLEHLPADATHLVVSAGGNNALMASGILSMAATSAAEVILNMAEIAETFAGVYQQLVDALKQRDLPTILCTVYEPNMGEPITQKLMSTGLALFNDRILRTAFQAGYPVIDLRRVCSEPADYANEIEPSVAGGSKIAAAIVQALTLPPNQYTVVLP